MKLLLLLTGSFFILTLTNAQDCKPFSFTMGIESGVSFGHAPVAGFNFGANFRQFSIRVGMDAHLSNKVKDGLLLRSQIGHTFDFGNWYGVAAVGHAYIYRSADIKGLNKSEFLINPEIGYKLDFKQQPISIYLSGVKAGEYKLAMIGCRGYF